ncbi:hypothetical protein GM415_05485 [Pseudodesulfovibrio cashew]|uniref:HD/PDEase domain-containing protein n=1 Tax=Pseudodesulfovibrio cashew TaxID=2678688 RepID=A0A6I6JBX6_9BACT|nr:HD domain-containing protein [Pseudodesulfovibrio cashew]QGY39591.1 hypothetical protein GM415_05485 [Pseudodesulfovibrio cashew]
MATAKTLYDFIDPADGEGVLREVEFLLARAWPERDFSVVRQAFRDVERLFAGEYPGYRACNTAYHDFEHTCAVFLAAVRLVDGALAEGETFPRAAAVKCVLAALFHDVGLIQAEGDDSGTGAVHTVGHEARSIRFMRENLEGKLAPEDLDDVADCIRCTILNMPPGLIEFRTDDMRRMGEFVGSADLLAQMADRYYLEKLPRLFEEFREAGIPGYASAHDLLVRTRVFYQEVARPRLERDLGRARRFMAAHFRSRWQAGEDLYARAIQDNLKRLDRILSECGEDLDCFREQLRLDGVSLDLL